MNADEENRSRLSGLFERVAAAKDRRIAVMGSMNVDYTVVTERLPQPGETVTGGPLQVLPGGKSANQAAAAGRLGAGVTMLGMVGSDDSGAFLIDQLKDARVDTSSIAAMEGPSGSTVITVDAAGENTIVYSAGANAQVSVDYVTSHSQAIQSAAVLGLCLESPLDAVIAAATVAHKAGIPVLLNDSPFLADLPADLIANTDILLVNEHEVAQLLGIDVDGSRTDIAYWRPVGEKLQGFGYSQAIVTLGSHGAVVLDGDRLSHVPALSVEAVDTTGCGDSFMGSVLAGTCAGLSLEDSAFVASYVAAYAARGMGAQASYGSAWQVLEYFFPESR